MTRILNSGSRFERGINLAVITASLAFLAVVGILHLHKPRDAKEIVLIGSKVAIPDVDWKQSNKTLVFALSTTCGYCSASAGFHQRLLRLAQREGMPSVAIFPQGAEEAQEYLSGLNLPIGQIRQVVPRTLGVAGTPTLMIVDSRGVVVEAWVGMLPAAKEAEVLGALDSKGVSLFGRYLHWPQF